MTNYSILEKNALSSLAGITIGMSSETAEEVERLFMRGASMKGADRYLYRVERMAAEWAVVAETVRPMLKLAATAYSGAVPDGLMDFIRERHFRSYFPGN